MLNAQYRFDFRDSLAKLILEKFAEGKTITARCQFVTFCINALPVLDSRTLFSYFLVALTKIPCEETVQAVLKTFLKAIPSICKSVVEVSSQEVKSLIGEMLTRL